MAETAPPSQTPEEIAAQAGVELAFQANEARDAKDPKFSKIDQTVGDLIGRGSLGESAVDAVFAQSAEIAKSMMPTAETLSSLTPEQQQKVTACIDAQAEKFQVSPNTFALLRTKGKGNQEVLTVAYAAPRGIYMGNWNEIFDTKEEDDFMVEVEGQQLDTRLGMTRAAYDAMIEQARVAGVKPLPDSEPTGEAPDEESNVWTSTWLTGEPAVGAEAPNAVVEDGKVRQTLDDAGSQYLAVRFRPALVVK